MAQTSFKMPGPIAPGNAVLFTLVPQDENGATEALDGLLNAVNDQAQAPTNAAGGPIGEQPDPLSMQILVQPPPDLSVDSVITGGDTDGDPSFIFQIDWDGSTNPVTGKAKQFGVTASLVPATPAP